MWVLPEIICEPQLGGGFEKERPWTAKDLLFEHTDEMFAHRQCC